MKIWKVSHGLPNFNSDELGEIEKNNIAVIYSNTPAKGVSSKSQSDHFTDDRQFNIFYSCHSNSSVRVLGVFTEKQADNYKYRKDNWLSRKYELIKKAQKSGGYNGGEARWWKPNDNSTFTEVKEAQFAEFEQDILTPFFGISLQELSIQYEKIKNKINMQSIYKQYIDLLESNKNLIFTGAPGTGKTYLAKEIAQQMTENHCIQFVQFHPSYDYTDFVEGLRPVKKGDELGFELKNGIFKTFCKQAKDNPSQKHVFIIDEINRAEISKVFGELFFALDAGYRGTDGIVNTQYANIQTEDTIFDINLGQGKFYIPENVYIIGTMNDIDRSVESFDFAIRRRFAWKEITPNERIEMWKGKIDDWKDPAKLKMEALNEKIHEIPGLGAAFQLGPAYFLKLENYKGDFTQLWENHLGVLLKEYLRGMPNADSLLQNLKKIYDK